MNPKGENILDNVKFDSHGLVTSIVQDDETHEVLMVAYMNREALEKTIETGESYFWSRSRQKIWHKGESSGHVQKVSSIAIDCDGDAILIKAKQLGEGACHTGYYSCFYRGMKPGETHLSIVGKKTFDAEKVYKK